MRILAIVAAALICGCDGGERAFMGNPGGHAGPMDGSGGAPGTGGAAGAVVEIGSDFTRADHDMCMTWPVCPNDVIAPATRAGRVVSNECKTAFDGVRVICGGCIRKSTCEQFVGRCVAPFVHNGNANDSFYVSLLTPVSCQAYLAAGPLVAQAQWVICTGDLGHRTPEGDGVAARTVCED